MRVHGAVGQNQGDVERPLAPRIHLVKLEVGQVVDEVGFPQSYRRDIGAAVHLEQIAFAIEMIGRTETLREGEVVVEDERLVVIEIQAQRQIVGAGQARRVPARTVEPSR